MSASPEQRFLEFHREHGAAIARKTARAFTANAADGDDLAQEILVALWQALPQFRGGAKVTTYAYRVAHSCALNWKRSRQRYARKLDHFALEPAAESVAAPRTDERLAWLYARIHELSPVDRSLLLLFLDRLSYAEIADVTGLTEANVGVRLHRLKHHLGSLAEPARNEL